MERGKKSRGRGRGAASSKPVPRETPEPKRSRSGRGAANSKERSSSPSGGTTNPAPAQTSRQKQAREHQEHPKETEHREPSVPDDKATILSRIASACFEVRAQSVLCEITGQKKPEPIEARPSKIAVDEKRAEITQEFYEHYFLGIEEQRKSHKKQKIKYTPVNTDYNKWKHMGKSYLISPEPEPLSEQPESIDFICNSVFKALATGGEGDSGKDEDDHNPMPWVYAQLNLSMNIDELGIDHLKAEFRERRLAQHAISSDGIADIAIARAKIEKSIRDYNDDRYCIYRPSISLPTDDFTGVQFPGIELSHFHFLMYVITLIEHHSSLTPPAPNHRTHISDVMYDYIPLLLETPQRQDMKVHLVVPAVHVAFLFRFFELLNRLDEYLNSIKFIPIRATFGLVHGVRADRTVSLPREITKMFENIESGASLSRMFCEVRNLAIALKCNDVSLIVSHCHQFVHAGNDDVSAMISDVSGDFPCQKPHLVKIVYESGIMRPVAVENTFEWMAPRPNIFPFYPLLGYRRVTRGDNETIPVFSSGELVFSMGVRDLDEEDMESRFGIIFKPESRSTLICLSSDVI